MESLLTPATENPRERHLRWLRESRRRRILVTIPRFLSPTLRARCVAYVDLACAKHTTRQLVRIVWPWLKAPQPAQRTPRGRQGVSR